MILLLGGTSHTVPIAQGLAQRGYRVLVSKATDVPLAVGNDPRIEVRSGPLDDNALAALINRRGIRAIVDATHPYAAAIHNRAARVAEAMGIPCLTLLRPSSIDPADPNVLFVSDHASAARLAFAFGRPVLLTTGSKNLTPYVEESQRAGLALIVRVLDHPTSMAACRAAGIADEQILGGRGPFSLETNRQQIRAHGIGVLVTKDSGPAGGTAEKLEAARVEGCRVIVVQRPPCASHRAFTSVEALLGAAVALLAAT
jgi:precorrin-6A/cobalt-precorrin-6A reductase